MNPAETTPLKPQRSPTVSATPTVLAPPWSPIGISQRLADLFDDWCDVVAPCPWTATAGRRAVHADPFISSHP
jgi:hypothetical protein